MNIVTQHFDIKNQDDFIDFMHSFIDNYKKNPGDWENHDILGFLEGLRGYCQDKKQSEVSWQVVAELLLASRVYE